MIFLVYATEGTVVGPVGCITAGRANDRQGKRPAPVKRPGLNDKKRNTLLIDKTSL